MKLQNNKTNTNILTKTKTKSYHLIFHVALKEIKNKYNSPESNQYNIF